MPLGRDTDMLVGCVGNQQMQEYLQQYNASLATCIPNFQPPPFPNFLFNYNTQASSSQQFAERMEEEGEEEGEDDYDNDDWCFFSIMNNVS